MIYGLWLAVDPHRALYQAGAALRTVRAASFEIDVNVDAMRIEM